MTGGSSKNNNQSGIPKPYTEYTIYFRLERAHLLQTSTGCIDEETLPTLDPNHTDPLEFPRPAKYENTALPPYWYSSFHKKDLEKNRKHRKRAGGGTMDLKTLSKTISASWRDADQEIIDYCKKLSKAEVEKYQARTAELNTSTPKSMKPISKKGSPFAGMGDTSSSSNPFGHSNTPVRTPSSIFNNSTFYANNQGLSNEDQQQVNHLLRIQNMAGISPSPKSVYSITASFVANSSDFLQKLSSSNSRLPFAKEGGQGANPISRKRKFVRRASAPPEFMPGMMLQQAGGLGGVQSMGFGEVGGLDPSSSSILPFAEGGELLDASIKAPAKRRVTGDTSSLASQDLQQLQQIRSEWAEYHGRGSVSQKKQQPLRRATVSTMEPSQEMGELRAIFQRGLLNNSPVEAELESGSSFTCVPDWEKKDADALLDMLNDT